jgi:hypothetical protein
MNRASAFPDGYVLAVEGIDDVVHHATVRTNWSDQHIFQRSCEVARQEGSHYVWRVLPLESVNCLWCVIGRSRV